MVGIRAGSKVNNMKLSWEKIYFFVFIFNLAVLGDKGQLQETFCSQRWHNKGGKKYMADWLRWGQDFAISPNTPIPIFDILNSQIPKFPQFK